MPEERPGLIWESLIRLSGWLAQPQLRGTAVTGEE